MNKIFEHVLEMAKEIAERNGWSANEPRISFRFEAAGGGQRSDKWCCVLLTDTRFVFASGRADSASSALEDLVYELEKDLPTTSSPTESTQS